MLAIFVSIAAVGTALVVVNGESVPAQVPFIVAFTMFGVVGALIVSRDGRNVIGLLLLLGAVATASSFLSGELMTWLVRRGHEGPIAVLFGLINNFGWSLGILTVIFLLPLLFPDGRLPSLRWRPFLWFILAFLGVINLSFIVASETFSGSVESITVDNPFYVSATRHLPNMDLVTAILVPIIFATSVASVLVRFRTAVGAERQQIKWVVFGFGAAFVSIILSFFVVQEGVASAIIGGAGFLAFPVSIGIAILKYHLYDLDVVVRKTFVYAALGLFATAVYLGLVVGVGAWLGRGSSFLTMAAAVVVAVTFQPVRARMTRLANRLVYGGRATPYEVLSEFSERLGDAYAEEDLLPRMARVLGEGIGAARTDVWLAVDRELRDVATWPDEAAALAPIAMANGDLPSIDDTDRVYPVQQAGELLGALTVRKPPSDPVTSSDERLIADLAGQAGLVLRNVRLTEALRTRLDDLKAAQKRLVSAQDQERRRLERNIHDGAQQQLVALTVKARLARQLTERDPSKTTEILTQIETEGQQALEDLRDLARGIYPPLLADKGLADAITAQARKSPVPVEVHAAGLGRFPQEVEAAVYFSVLEALQNIGKYAAASCATVRLDHDDRTVSFEVRDDGRGFDTSLIGRGTGLQGIADRLAALDGRLDIVTAPGAGTVVSGQVPAAGVEVA